MNQPILDFYEEYEFMSNFYDSPIIMPDGITYPTGEHAFQAHKYMPTKYPDWLKKRMEMAAMKDPGTAKSYGQGVRLDEPAWFTVRWDVMYTVVKRKFEQNFLLQELLLQTGDVYIEEGNCWGDIIWGVCDGKGFNWLGKILMQVRKELQQ